MATFDTLSGLTGTWVRSTGTQTPAVAYAAWCTELGVSNSATLTAMDGDDFAYAFTLAAAALGTSTQAFFASEGAIGLYATTPANTTSGSSIMSYMDSSKVSRMYSFGTRPTLFMTFHAQVDMESINVKLQRSGTTTIMTGRVRARVGGLNVTDFAIRFDGATLCSIILAPVDQPVNFYLFGANVFDEVFSSTVALGTIALIEISGLAYSAPTYALRTRGPARNSVSYGAAAAYSGVRVLAPRRSAFDFNTGGLGRVYGFIKVDGSPDYPVSRRVRLYRDRDGLLIGEQWSNALTGLYDFKHVDPTHKYTVVSFDHTHTFNAVVADNITPDLE